jgi:hypothetical protein
LFWSPRPIPLRNVHVGNIPMRLNNRCGWIANRSAWMEKMIRLDRQGTGQINFDVPVNLTALSGRVTTATCKRRCCMGCSRWSAPKFRLLFTILPHRKAARRKALVGRVDRGDSLAAFALDLGLNLKRSQVTEASGYGAPPLATGGRRRSRALDRAIQRHTGQG